MFIDYLCYLFKELLKEGQQKIPETFSHYYVPNVEIKDFSVLIDGKSFFDLPLKKWRISLRKNCWNK